MLYTMEQWTKDGTFNATAGQEISEDVYNAMLNCMPPESLPRAKARWALSALNIPVHAGFLMGEPHSSDKDGLLYLAFGMNDYGRSVNHKEPHYYYLGLSHKAPTMTGSYYYFDCMNAVVNKFFKISAFKDDAEAISTAANYEATLYRYEFDSDGEQISRKTLYEPAFY